MPGTTDTVKAILTPGEFVIRKEAVDMIGVPMLNMINNMPEKGGHSNIDNLIARATIENMKGMYGGGMVQAGPKPMGTGGMVDAYAGGGMVMDQYGHGGKVKKNLKPVPQGNPGLGKLPEAVRNKMGYMQKGGMVEEKMYGYQNGGSIYGMNRTPEGMMQAIYEMPTEDGNRYYLGEASRPQLNLSRQIARSRAEEKAMNMPQDSISFDVVQQLLNPEAAESEGKKGLMGLLGFQDGGMIGPPLPPEMMGQAMNRQLSESIDMRMADPQMVGGIGVARDQAMALQDSINMNTVDSARKSLQLLKLRSLLSEGGDTLNFEGSMMPPNQDMENARVRDLLEFLKMQTMQRGMGSVKQGLGDEPMRALR
jgi:hypothetical protein